MRSEFLAAIVIGTILVGGSFWVAFCRLRQVCEATLPPWPTDVGQSPTCLAALRHAACAREKAALAKLIQPPSEPPGGSPRGSPRG